MNLNAVVKIGVKKYCDSSQDVIFLLPGSMYSVDNFIIDFYCPKLKLAIEIDGSVHNEPGQKEYDIKRQEHLETFGIKFLRLTNEEIDGNPNKAFMKIENEIEVLNLTSSKTPGRKEVER